MHASDERLGLVVMWVSQLETKSTVVKYWRSNTTVSESDVSYAYGKQWRYDIAGMDYVSPVLHCMLHLRMIASVRDTDICCVTTLLQP